MAKLDAILKNKVVIYIPCTIGNIMKDNIEVASYVAGQFADLFGGANITEATGYYVMEGGETVKEKNYLVTVFFGNEEARMNIFLDSVVDSLLKTLEQETVGVEINNEFRLYSAD